MEKIRALIADGRAWIAAATPRERRLLAMAAGAALIAEPEAGAIAGAEAPPLFWAAR